MMRRLPHFQPIHFRRLLPLFLLATATLAAAPSIGAEVCVYGGTPAGVMAAAAARQGHSVELIDINNQPPFPPDACPRS